MLSLLKYHSFHQCCISQFQTNFTRSFSNLLNTDAAVIRESQLSFNTASNILNTLNAFGKRLSFENSSSRNTLLQETNFQLQVQDIPSNQLEMQHDFVPVPTNVITDIDVNPQNIPIQQATISLPSDLLRQLGLQVLLVWRMSQKVSF